MSATLPASDLVTLTIDGVEVQAPKGSLLVEAAKQIHRDIPVYCYHSKLGPAGLCRVCLVEIEGMPKLQIACNTPVADKMVVHTLSDKALEGRRVILEMLLLNHPLDCPICDKGGECDLQDYAMAYGQGASRMVDAKDAKPKAVDLGPTIVLDEERCILCLRCVRFDDLITHERSLRTEDRGSHAIIATATGSPYVSDFSGNVTELCPVGALTSKTYRFRSRPWDNHRATTTCTQCSVGCAMHVDVRLHQIQRTMMVEDDPISDGWLCDRGRYNVGYVTDERRLTAPLYKENGAWVQIGWDDAIALWAKALRDANPAAVGALGGGRLLNEEAYLFAHVHESLGIANRDWRSGRMVRAFPGPRELRGTPEDLENATVIITYGAPPSQTAPVLDLRLRKAVMRRGARWIAVGEQRVSSAVPSTKVASFEEAVKLVPDGAQRIAIVWDGIEVAEAPRIAAWAGSLPAGSTFRLIVPGEQPNAFGAETLGMLPGEGGRDTRGMLETARDGKLAVLSILGANPALHFPDRELALAALQAVPFLVVSDLFLTETAEFATLVLPACGAFEKSGTTTNFCGDVLPVTASVAAPEGTWADGDMLIALAESLGVTVPAPDALEATVRELIAGTPKHAPLPAAGGASRAIAGVEVLRVIPTTTIFAGGGTVAHDVRIAHLRPRAVARMNGGSARRVGVADGDLIDLAGPEGAKLENLLVVVDERVPADGVELVDGVPEAPLGGLRGAVSVHVAAKRAGMGVPA